MQQATIVMWLDGAWDFEEVSDDAVHEDDVVITTAQGTTRRRVFKAATETAFHRCDMTIPDPDNLSGVALMNLANAQLERSAPIKAITGVSGDHPGLVAKLAALFEAEIVEED